jgi:hypothetical protein
MGLPSDENSYFIISFHNSNEYSQNIIGFHNSEKKSNNIIGLYNSEKMMMPAPTRSLNLRLKLYGKFKNKRLFYF